MLRAARKHLKTKLTLNVVRAIHHNGQVKAGIGALAWPRAKSHVGWKKICLEPVSQASTSKEGIMKMIEWQWFRICKKLNISYPPDLATPAKESHQVESIANYLIIKVCSVEGRSDNNVSVKTYQFHSLCAPQWCVAIAVFME